MPIRLSRYKLKKLQLEVLMRDNWTCQDCGRYTEAPPHHKIFLSQGGSDTKENMETLCVRCHALKHGVTIK